MPRSETPVSRQLILGSFLLSLVYGIVLLVWLSRLPDLAGLGHDDGIYLQIAQSVRAGEGWTDGHLPEAVQSSRYPPLYPALLALGGWLTGTAAKGLDGASRLLALNGVFLSLALALFLRLLARDRHGTPARVLALGLASFLLLDLMLWASFLFSESLFLLVTVMALHAACRFQEKSTSGRFLWLVASVALVPLVRTLGVAVVAAVAWDLWRRTRRPSVAVALLVRVALLAGPVFAWAWWQGRLDPAWADFGLIGRSYGHLLGDVAGHLPTVLVANLVQLADCLREALVPWWQPHPVDGFLGRSTLVLGLVALAALGARGLPGVVRRYLWIGLLLLLAWPYPTTRLLHAFQPFLLWSMVLGLEVLAERLRVPARRWLLVAMLLALVGSHGWELRARRIHQGPAAFLRQPIVELQEAAEWIRDHGEGGDVLAGAADPLLSFWAERPGVWYWRTDQPWLEKYEGRMAQWRALFRGPLPEQARSGLAALAEDVLRQYRRVGVTWLVVCGPGGNYLYEPLAQGLVAPGSPHSGRFRLSFQSSQGQVRVYRFLSPP